MNGLEEGVRVPCVGFGGGFEYSRVGVGMSLEEFRAASKAGVRICKVNLIVHCVEPVVDGTK